MSTPDPTPFYVAWETAVRRVLPRYVPENPSECSLVALVALAEVLDLVPAGLSPNAPETGEGAIEQRVADLACAELGLVQVPDGTGWTLQDA
jgi:hypothetical protein